MEGLPGEDPFVLPHRNRHNAAQVLTVKGAPGNHWDVEPRLCHLLPGSGLYLKPLDAMEHTVVCVLGSGFSCYHRVTMSSLEMHKIAANGSVGLEGATKPPKLAEWLYRHFGHLADVNGSKWESQDSSKAHS